MTSTGNSSKDRGKAVSGTQSSGSEPSIEHFFLIVMHRKWMVLSLFLLISAATVIVTLRLPDVYTADTLILVDPQQVPENIVQSTVTGDIGNRLGALSQQIMSATRLQRIIDTFGLYTEERKTQPRENIINQMRSDITVRVVSDFRGGNALQAFRITYRGQEPRVVAQVTNELASLFIEENLKARERMATGTNAFLENQLEETRNKLEEQENRLKEFKLQHLGEMPEHQPANIQILTQLQARMQGVTDSLNRAEQQKTFLQTALETRREAARAEIQRIRDERERAAAAAAQSASAGNTGISTEPGGPTPEEIRDEAELKALLARYGELHPDVQRLKREIEERRLLREQIKEQQESAVAAKADQETENPEQVTSATPPQGSSEARAQTDFPELRVQLEALEKETERSKQDQEKILALIAQAQAKIEAVPLREQEITDLVRDYEISKEHYQDLLAKKLNAETGTDLEIRQKGERFTVLDPAQVPETPSGPKRIQISIVGSGIGLMIGLALAFLPEVLGSSITMADQVAAYSGVPVLGVIPTISTRIDRQRRRRWIIAGVASSVATILLGCSLLLYHFRDRIF